jgi:hypothetical protein
MLIVSNHDVRSIIDGLPVNDKIKSIINNLILRYDHSYVNFVYTVFSVYTNTYSRINGEYSDLSHTESIHIYNIFNELIKDVKYDRIFIADRYDVLFNSSCVGDPGDRKFTHYFYEDMYSRLEYLVGVKEAPLILEDIFECLEYIIKYIEANVTRILEKKDSTYSNSHFSLYLDIIQDRLMLVIVDS